MGLYCIIEGTKGNIRIEDASYWKKGSYKMNTINSLLIQSDKSVRVEYYENEKLIDRIILGKKK